MNKSFACIAITALIPLYAGCNCQKTVNEPKQEQSPIQTQEAKPMNQSELIALPSGLRYQVTKPATDPNARKPAKGNSVVVHYTGWLADANGNPIINKKFDSSRDRNQPFQFAIGTGQVIKGWDEGVMNMKVGEHRRLIIPAPLAYGNRSIGDAIPSNSTLVFDVELLDIK